MGSPIAGPLGFVSQASSGLFASHDAGVNGATTSTRYGVFVRVEAITWPDLFGAGWILDMLTTTALMAAIVALLVLAIAG